VACLVATDILQLVGLRSFRTAALLLVGLLLYDTFWVFGSPQVVGDNVMLTVATSDVITGPTRLLFPRIPGGVGEAAEFPFSLLGLGDVAIPGAQ
jgi:minor histocompatibility antigen H13